MVDVTAANNKLKTMVLYEVLFGGGAGGRGNNEHDAVGENGSTFNFLSIRKIVTR